MKRLLLTITAGFLITGTCVWLAGCKKEANQNTQNKEQQECSTCKDGEMLANRINLFKESMNAAKADSKNTTEIAFDEAIVNMELLINAAHAFPFDSYSQRENIEFSFQLPKNSVGNVNLADVAAAYEQMKSRVRNEYINCGFAQKGLILVSLSENKQSKNDGTIDVMVTIGEKGDMETNPFNDCWYYGEDIGMCNGTFYLEKDGADTIAAMINANNPIHRLCDHPGPGHHLVIEPQTVIELQGNEYMQGNNYLMFFRPDDGNGFSNEEMQLSATEMSQYYYNEEYLIQTLLPQLYNYPFPQYVLINCLIDGDKYYDNNCMIWNLRHKNTLYYAKRYWVRDDVIPGPDPID